MKLQLSTDELRVVASYWNAIPVAPVEGTNHFFYEVVVDDRPGILRLTTTGYRELPAVLAEIHWMKFLEEKAPIAKVIPSLDNRTAVPLQIGGRQLIACLFEKITGQRLRESEAWGAAVFREWGRTMAALHSFTRQYQAGNHAHRQLEGQFLSRLAEKAEGKNSLVLKMLEEKWEKVQHIPTQEWGLIHSDLTQANMRFRDDRLYIFDFDNCQYAPFLYDIAVTLYVTLFGLRAKRSFYTNAEMFMENFFEGYGVHKQSMLDVAMLRNLLEFFNALVYLSCTQRKGHPFMQYAAYNLKNGTLKDIGFESFLN